MDEETIGLLERYRSGELGPDERRALEERLAQEPHLAELLAELEENAAVAEELATISGLLRQPAAPPLEVDGFQIAGELHRGGQGVVYRAVEEGTHRPVALKLLLAGAHASRRERLRFEREIELAANLQHPNIVAVFRTGVTPDGHQYFVMPLIDGVRLDRWVREQRLDVKATLRLFLKVTTAVTAAHQRGVIHRDLKPGNILVDREGEPHVLDFGLAKPFGAALDREASLRTLTGEFAGTLAYASPEQVQGEHDRVEVRSDVYALGVVLYCLLAGRFPYPVDGPITDVLEHIVHRIPDQPSRFRREIAADVDVIVLKAIAKEIDRRYATVAHLARDIELYLDGLPIEAKSDSGWYVLKKTLSRYRLAASALALLIVILATATVVSLKFWRDAERRRAEAETATDRATYEKGTRNLVSRFAWDLVSAVDVETLEQSAATIETEFEDGLMRALLHDQFGMAFFQAGRLDLAEIHLTRALELYGDYPDIEELGYYRTLKNRAVVYSETARLAEAERDLRSFCRWIDARRDLDQEQRLLAAGARADLGFVLKGRQRFAEAEELLIPALAEAVALHGEEAPRTQRIRRILGACLVGRDRLADAATILDQALVLARARRPPDLEDLVLCLNARADCARSAREYERAIELLSESLELCRATADIGEPILLTTMNNLAGAVLHAGHPQQAARLFAEVIDRQTASLGGEHPRTLTTKGNLAMSLGVAGQHWEAVTTLRDLVEVFQRTLGRTHADTLYAVNSLGWQLGKCGRQDQAVAVLGETIQEVLAAQAGDASWFVHYMRVNRAAILIEMERLEEAEQELVSGHRELALRLGADSSYAKSAARLLAKLYRSTGRDQEARRYEAPAPEK